MSSLHWCLHSTLGLQLREDRQTATITPSRGIKRCHFLDFTERFPAPGKLMVLLYFTAVQSLAQIPSTPSSGPQLCSHLPVQLISCTLEQGDDSPDGFICRERSHVISSPFSKPHVQMLCLVPRKNSLSDVYPPPSLPNPFQPVAKCLVILSQQKHPPAFEFLTPRIKP